jgi:cytochrome b561
MEKVDSLNKHGFATRLFHMFLALAVVLQLLTSLVMQMPREGRPGNTLFELHQYSGLGALVLSLGFWLVLALRRRGTEVGQLWPWFSVTRRLALSADTRRHWDAIKSLRLPAYNPEAALPSAVHGLGLLLITAMATSGTSYYMALLIKATDNPVFRLILEIHQLLANFVWAYLIGHAGLGLIQHFTGNLPLTTMWSLRRDNSAAGLD